LSFHQESSLEFSYNPSSYAFVWYIISLSNFAKSMGAKVGSSKGFEHNFDFMG